ncbi:hypothetical protein D3C86_1058360 [compost metagenome]
MPIRLNPLTLALAATLLVACQASPPISQPHVAAPEPGVVADQLGPSAIAGRAAFPPSQEAPYHVSATGEDVSAYATVAVIEPGTARTMATGLTGAQGAFAIDVDSTFSPVLNGYYYLQVSKRVGGVSGNQVSMLTLLKWTSKGWASITNASGGSGSLVVNPSTTALTLIDREDPATGFDDVMGKVSGPAFASVAAFGSHGISEIMNRVAAIVTQLQQDLDPVGDRPLASSGLMAPDDAGDEAIHHDYKLTNNGQESTFVWIPVFTAYQLIVPANCGAAGTAVGTWVKARPASGIEGTDWARETFGGFYVGKYEASRNDATGAVAGSDTNLKVQAGVVAWTDLNWDAAAKACLAYDAHCHLLRDDEWTALAVWSMINNVTVYGNNNTRTDANDPAITFAADPNHAMRSLTGAGTKVGWTGTTNLTTHTGTTAGVYDLNGNIWEWTANIGGASGVFVLNDVVLPINAPTGGEFFTSIHTDPRLRRYGVAGSADWIGLASFHFDYFWIRAAKPAVKSYRGGDADDKIASGIWTISLYDARNATGGMLGFRPALRF